jgi:hypothetical protein
MLLDIAVAVFMKKYAIFQEHQNEKDRTIKRSS